MQYVFHSVNLHLNMLITSFAIEDLFLFILNDNCSLQFRTVETSTFDRCIFNWWKSKYFGFTGCISFNIFPPPKWNVKLIITLVYIYMYQITLLTVISFLLFLNTCTLIPINLNERERERERTLVICRCLRIIKSQYLKIIIPPMRTTITMTPALPPALSTATFTMLSAPLNWFAEMYMLLHILILTKNMTLNCLRSIYMHCNGYTSIYKDNTFREKRNIFLKRS